MKKIILSALVASATLIAADAPMYKTGVLLPANGEAIYKQECIQCHSADGKQTKMFDNSTVEYAPITGLETATLAIELKGYRYGSVNKYGYGAMMKSSLVDLSYEEIDALSEYITTTLK
ncbi:MAG: cytochrome c553 [Sulfurimonas sp.]|jgi:cytochrome c553|uniref:c-type cytochrome n=1 Tax=Sulfurimonas sp. TaxID=2022749 RepID=UPI0039E3904D